MYWGGYWYCRAAELSLGSIRITHLDLVDDALIFAATTEALAESLGLLSEKAEPLGWESFGIRPKSRRSVTFACGSGETVEVTQTFTLFDSVIH